MIYSSVPVLTIERDLEICLYETSVTIILLPSLNDYINHNNAIDWNTVSISHSKL